MITIEHRPRTFKEISGQDFNKKILCSIVKNPEQAPKSIILQGFHGTGKTTASRCFARALNCKDKKNVEPCLECSVCGEDISSSPFYMEYDSAVTGSVEKIREMRESFYFLLSGGWKVITLDEFHLASPQAQSALLKVLEDAPNRVFFMFATTNVSKILNTIRSRSLELKFDLVATEEIVENLSSICQKENIHIDQEILEIIAVRSGGHVRDAQMLLSKYVLVDEDDFMDSVNSSEDLFLELLISIGKQNEDKLFSILDELLTFTLSDLKSDFHRVLLKIVEGSIKGSDNPRLNQLLNIFGEGGLVKIVIRCMDRWLMDSFSSDLEFQSAMLSLYQLISSSMDSGTDERRDSIYKRAKKK